MTKPLKVTVAIPARNAEKTLPEALKSIQEQTLIETEIILVDHNSEDRTHGIMMSAAKDDPRIRVLQCRGTFVEAANLAWQAGSAPYIARMDSDDVSHPERLQRQLDLLHENASLSACGTLVRIVKRNPDGSPIPPDEGYRRYESWINSVTSAGEIHNQRFVDSPIANPTSLVKREIMETLGGYQDPAWAEDYDFWLRALEAGYRIGKVNQRLLDWYDDPGRSTRTIERYETSQFQAAKAHFLARIPSVQERGVVICGAGPIGKEMCKLLRAENITIHAFIEVNPRQIGNRILEIPVVEDRSLIDFHSKAIALSAVGLPGARDKIRTLALKCRFSEGDDFFCVA